jgi:hypothetical protein
MITIFSKKKKKHITGIYLDEFCLIDDDTNTEITYGVLGHWFISNF